MVINITPGGVIESTIMYGVVHGIWQIIKKMSRAALVEARRERNRIIHMHVKTGHEGRLKHCVDEACASLRKPAPVQHLELPEELHTES
jgi:hypothetical protein